MINIHDIIVIISPEKISTLIFEIIFKILLNKR